MKDLGNTLHDKAVQAIVDTILIEVGMSLPFPYDIRVGQNFALTRDVLPRKTGFLDPSYEAKDGAHNHRASMMEEVNVLLAEYRLCLRPLGTVVRVLSPED